jgi:nitroreductase
MDKSPHTSLPINPLAAARWSPRAFLDKPVEPEKLTALFEAARWSPSGGNEQPWRFIVGIRPDSTWEKIFSVLDEGNRDWNGPVPVLMLAVANTISNWDGNESPYFGYDTGQAVAHLSIEASQQGLYVHQMGGFSAEKARTLFEIPDTFKPMTAIAVGYLGDPERLNQKLKARERAARSRQPLESMVFGEKFGAPFFIF